MTDRSAGKSMRWILCVACALCALSGSSFGQEKPGNSAVVEVRKIWDKAPHNAFTDLIRFKDRWFCAFREATNHTSRGGVIRIITSTDGEEWTPAALIDWPEAKEGAYDLRYPRLTVAPDGRLMLTALVSASFHKTLVRFSGDGLEWSGPAEVPGWHLWLWRVTWHKGVAYSMRDHMFGSALRLLAGKDGINYKPLADFALDGHPGETSLSFAKDDTCYAIARRDHIDDSCLLGASRPPYEKWTWKDIGLCVSGGPVIELAPDGRHVVAGRCYDEQRNPRTVLLFLDIDKAILTPFAVLPSGGDTGYPGMVFRDGLMWISYYSSHEEKASIYLAKVKLPPANAAAPAIRLSRTKRLPYIQEHDADGPSALTLEPVERGIVSGELYDGSRYVKRSRNWMAQPVQFPNGDILIVWEHSPSGVELTQENKLLASRSTDGGKTWSAPFVFLDYPDLRESQPRFVRVGDKVHCVVVIEDNRESFSWQDYRGRLFSTYMMTTADRGKTWSEPRVIWKDNFPEQPLLLANGEILYTHYYGSPGTGCMISSDGGATWQVGGKVPGGGSGEPVVVELKDGTIYCLIRHNRDGWLWESSSKDHGRTWAESRRSQVPSPGAPARLLRLKSGRILLVWNNVHVKAGLPRNPFTAALSEDECRTWKYIRDIRGDEQNRREGFSNHGVCQLSDGRILVAYQHNYSIGVSIFDETWVMEGKGKLDTPEEKE